ncbi:MAG: hypothetical protein QG656_1448 [Candidatus Hydrogenedentes bacterium]|nr:hypothetical protein [Candidatus Hydrogenedentota bacterium]
MRRWVLLLLAGVLASGWAQAQDSVVADVISGKLVKPKVGLWAWYDLTDTAANERYVLRQAIVGEEKVDRRTGYWLEIQVIPQLGYQSIYKMLVTGPASDPKHVHKMVVREGVEAARVIELPKADDKAESPPAPERASLGKETVQTLGGGVEAEHLQLTSGGKTSDVWVNDIVRPMGIVKMVSADGELMLRSYGEGGDDARSVIDDPPLAGGAEPVKEPKIEVHVGGDTVPAPDGTKPEDAQEAPAEAAPKP